MPGMTLSKSFWFSSVCFCTVAGYSLGTPGLTWQSAQFSGCASAPSCNRLPRSPPEKSVSTPYGPRPRQFASHTFCTFGKSAYVSPMLRNSVAHGRPSKAIIVFEHDIAQYGVGNGEHHRSGDFGRRRALEIQFEFSGGIAPQPLQLGAGLQPRIRAFGQLLRDLIVALHDMEALVTGAERFEILARLELDHRQ